jgi:type I restriction enzyme S subunit
MKLQRPKSWETSKLGELAVLVLGGDWGEASTFDSPEYQKALCIRGSEFRNWDVDKGSTAVFRKIKKSSLSSRTLKEGDILVEISGGGPEQPVGRTVVIDRAAIMRAPDVPKICTNFVRLLRTVENVDSKYINYYLVFFYKSGKIVAYQAGSNNLRNLKFKDYLNIDIPIPTLAEQHRIVEKIEELFSELDKGIENLTAARERLVHYRQAVLKSAFEGGLTKGWRINHQSANRGLGGLKNQILCERRDKFSQALTKWEAAGKEGSKPKPPKLISVDSSKDLTFLPKLPEGWSWEKIGNLAHVGTGVTPLKGRTDFYEGGQIPWVTSGALNNNFVKEASNYVTTAALIETGLKIYPKNTLLVAMYGEGKTRGKCSELLIDATINQAIAAIVFEGSAERFSKYVKLFFQKNYSEIRLKSSGGVQPNLNLGIIENTYVPLSPVEEMEEIVSEVDAVLSRIDEIEGIVDASVQQINTLRQSILQKAFSGKLVSQDSNDEPASKLLARIKAEIANSKPSKKKKAA